MLYPQSVIAMRLQVPELLTTSLLLVAVLAEVAGANPRQVSPSPVMPAVTASQTQPKPQPSPTNALAPGNAAAIVPMSVPSSQASGHPMAGRLMGPVVQPLVRLSVQSPVQPIQPIGVRQSLINTSDALDALLHDQ